MAKQNDTAFPHDPFSCVPGLTKLEYFAAAALPSLLGDRQTKDEWTYEEIVETAVYVAKRLLKELEK